MVMMMAARLLLLTGVAAAVMAEVIRTAMKTAALTANMSMATFLVHARSCTHMHA